MVWSDQFHDYVECVRVKTTVMPARDKTVAMTSSWVRSLLAYIDSKEPDRLSKAHPLYHGEAEA